MTLEKPLLEIIWGSNHHVSTYPAPIMPDENALLRGLHKFAEPATQFGGAISRFFNFNAAGAGEISDATASTWTANIPSNSGANAFANTTSPFAQNQGSEFQSAFGQTQRSVPPLASGAAPFNAPLKRPSVFATDNAFGTPAAPSELYIPKTTVFREANAAIKKAPLSFGSPNPFAKSAAPATLPTEASAENQRSLFDRITPPSQSLGAKPVDDKPLFLGGEDVVSDEEEETEEDNVIPTNPTAWTSLLPNKAGSASTNPGQGVDFSRPSSGQGIDFSKPLSSNGLQYSNVKSAAPNTTQFTAANTNGFTPTLPPQQNTPKFNFQGRLNTPAPAPSIEAQPAPGFHFAPLGAIPGQAIAGAEAAAKAAEAEEKLENERRQQEEAAARKLREEQEAAAKAEREREHEEAVLKEKLEREAAIAREEREREQILVEKAEKFRNRHLIEKFYYPYVEKAKKKRRRTERELRKRHRNEYSEDPQWWPIVKDGNLYKQSVEEVSQLVFKSAELRESVPDIIHLALEESNISRANYRMLLHNNDHTGKSHLWFGQKFLGGKNAITVPSSRGLGNEFHAQLNVTADEAVDVGFLVFGCSTDFSISNEDRFMQDSAQLHNIVDYLTQHTKMHKIAVMVICYRSPLDNEPANPMGLDGSRTLGKARKNRVEMVTTVRLTFRIRF